MLLLLSCILVSVCAGPKSLSIGRMFFFRRLPATCCPVASKCAKTKNSRMPEQYSVRKIRSSDLDRILQVEHASFRKDAYDRNLFAEFLHKCGDLFLVVERGAGICGYMIT